MKIKSIYYSIYTFYKSATKQSTQQWREYTVKHQVYEMDTHTHLRSGVTNDAKTNTSNQH